MAIQMTSYDKYDENFTILDLMLVEKFYKTLSKEE